jgi:hypothetical protein
MRVIVVALVWGFASMSCAKDPAPSDSTKALQPAAPTAGGGAAPTPSSDTIEVEPNVIRESDVKSKGKAPDEAEDGVPSDRSGAADPGSPGHAEEGGEVDDE